MLTSLTSAGEAPEQTGVGISSLIDAWLLVRNLEQGGERTRALQVLKARGIGHSNQIRELRITPRGVTLPMMFFIMPTIFLIVGGPAVLRIMDTFLR